MTFSEQVRYVRGKLYLTQKQLADELGVSFATVNRWESMGKEPQFLTKKKFESYCKTKGIIFEEVIK